MTVARCGMGPSVADAAPGLEVIMAWIALLVAGLLECGWAVGLKYTHGFTKLWPSVLTAIALAGSMWLLAWAAKTIPIGTAYAVWVGIGALGTAILGVLLFKEPVSIARAACLVMLLAAIVGLKFTAGPSGTPTTGE